MDIPFSGLGASCAASCLDCYRSCLGMGMIHCLTLGGAHAARPHMVRMASCAEICRTAAHLLIIESPHASALCRVCADVCEACADDCDALGDMRDCVDACRTCADLCRRYSEAEG